MKRLLQYSLIGLILGFFTVIITVLIMRLVIPAETLSQYTIPTAVNTTGAVELVIIYIIATVLVGSAVEMMFDRLTPKKAHSQQEAQPEE